MSETAAVIDQLEEQSQVEKIELPKELQFDAEFNGWDDEQKKSETEKYYEANPDRRPGAKTEEVASDVVDDKPAEASEEKQEVVTDTDAPAYDYSKDFGGDYTSKEKIAEALKEAKELKEKNQEIAEAFANFEKDRLALEKMKSPVPEQFRKQIDFFNATGISDSTVIREVLALKPEDVDNNPLAVLTAALLLDLPEYAQKGYAKAFKQAALENGVDPNTPFADLDEDSRDALQLKATRAFKNISEKTKDLGKEHDFFAESRQNVEIQEKQRQENVKAWSTQVAPLTSEFSKGIKTKFKDPEFGEIDITIAGSEKEVTNILKSLEGYMGDNAPSEQTIHAVKTALSKSIMTVDKVHDAIRQALKATYTTLENKASQEAIRKNHNGGPTKVTKSDKPNGAKTFDEFLETKKG